MSTDFLRHIRPFFPSIAACVRVRVSHLRNVAFPVKKAVAVQLKRNQRKEVPKCPWLLPNSFCFVGKSIRKEEEYHRIALEKKNE